MSTETQFNLKVSGTPVTPTPASSSEIARLFDIKKSFDLTAAARGGGKMHTIELQDEIVQLTTTDGVVWYGYADDLPDLTGAPTHTQGSRGGKENSVGGFTLPSTIRDARGGSRGVGSFLKNALLQVFKQKGVASPAELTARAIGRRIDDTQCSKPGLHRVLSDRSLEAADVTSIDTSKPALLFIHGTISSFEGGFSTMDTDGWSALRTQYGNNIFAFNHRTLTESPTTNALSLLSVLPKGVQLDLITHSRGGLIGDILVRCDARRQDKRGYAKQEIESVRNTKPAKGASQQSYVELAIELETLTKLARRSNLTIRRVIRVACPAHGTRLLDRRLDHFAQILFNATKFLVPGSGIIIELLETFVLAILKEREDPSTFPGLLSMVPDSPLVAINNTSYVELPGTLVSIAGDGEVGGGFGQSLKIILSNLYFTSANDLIVHTDSMSRGITQRREGNFTLTLRSEEVDHFSYFRVRQHMLFVTQLLRVETVTVGLELVGGLALTDNLSSTQGRGALVNKAYQPGELYPEAVSGQRPIIVMLPGIMGSNLYHNGDLQWVKLTAIMNGALVDKLKYVKSDASQVVTAESAIKEFYGELADYLDGEGFDVSLHPYDWRRSIIDEAKALKVLFEDLLQHQQPIRILAHSMGGLLMRQFIFDNPTLWKKLCQSHNTRVVFLGTPWRGSHLITQLLTGHLSRIRQLGLLDLHNSREGILAVVAKFPGVTHLLPLDDPRTFDLDVWQDLADASRARTPVYSQTMHSELIKYKNRVDKGIKNLTIEDYDRMIYVAGHHESTVDDFNFRYRRFFEKNEVEYIGTSRGDGSVTWERGIPRGLPSKNLYYTGTEHGLLAADTNLFPGLVDLLRKGKTQHSSFDKTQPDVGMSRGGAASAKTHQLRNEPLSGLSPTEVLFGIHTPRGQQNRIEDPLHVKVFNGDLKWAQYPLMVGHFEGFSIISAERALDRYLGNVLTERHLMGFYPGAIGQQELIVDTTRRPHGAVVVGLGQKEDLTGYLLAKTVQKGLVKYALFRRDNFLEGGNEPSGGLGISMLIIGSNFGQLPMQESIRNLLLGVQQANETITNFNEGRTSNLLKRIVEVELVDFYEDRAYEAYQIIQDIQTRGDIAGLSLSASILEGFGSRKRFLREVSTSWWQPITTTVVSQKLEYKDEVSDESEIGKAPVTKVYTHKYLAFDTYNRGSSVSVDRVDSNLQLAKSIADKMSHLDAEVKGDAKVLFQLLIPKRYKDFIRNHRNLLWRLDLESAAFPWELFSDDSTGEEPTFVRAGMIRQLKSETAEMRSAPVRIKEALVIADPLLGNAVEEYGQLNGALLEGKRVRDILRAKGDYKVHEAISADGLDTMRALVVRPYRVIHIAAHGVFSALPGRTGIVIENGELITPGTLKQLSNTPELVFVNCCHLGDVEAKIEEASRNRHRLAANIGTQLIESGVRAVIVAGWRVDDAAALVFAETFYASLFGGQTFGEAVLHARKKCWKQYPDNTTWGAYQCYGDPFYRLDPERSAPTAEDDISLAQEIELELANLASQARNVTDESGEELRRLQRRAHEILARADELEIKSAGISESEAKFQSYIGNYDAALDRYDRLFQNHRGNFELRSYYSYINLKARHLTNEALAGRGSRQEAYDQVCDFAAQLENQQISDKPGVTLFSDLGSINKRKAALAATQDEAIVALRTSAGFYLKAARALGLDSPEAIYHVCSFITLTALAETRVEARAKIVQELKRSPNAYFERWSDERSYLNSERNSPYALLRGANLKLAQVIWSILGTDAHKLDLQQAAEDLIIEHRNQRRQGFNIRDVRGQLEHYDLIIAICKLLNVQLPVAVKQLGRIRDSLQSTAFLLSEAPKVAEQREVKPEAVFIAKDATITAAEATGTLSAEPISQSRASRIIHDDEGDQLIVSVEIDMSNIPLARDGSKPERLSVQIPDGAVAALTRVTIDDDEEGEQHFLAWIPTAKGASAKTRGASIHVTNTAWLEIYILDRGRGNGKIKAFFKKAKRVVVEFFRQTKNFVNKELRNKYSYQVLRLDQHDRIEYQTVDKTDAFVAATLNGTEQVDRSLLMLHGMFNTARGTFKDLLDLNGKAEPGFAKLLTQRYGRRALVMNMPTIFHSFQQNVGNLPVKTIRAKTLDIMANSRGTNVARHLCNVLDVGQGPKRGKVWLAGGPAYGTPLADADHMLTLVNRITMMIQVAGKPLGPVVPIITWLLERVAEKVLSGEGLKDMALQSESLKFLNHQWDFENPSVRYIGSDFTPKKNLKRLIDAKLIDGAVMKGVKNDGVIPMQGTLGLAVGEKYSSSDPLRFRVPDKNACGHFMYYQQKEVLQRLQDYLLSDDVNPIV